MKQYKYRQDQLPTKNNSKLLTLVGDNKHVLEVGCAMGFHTRAMTEKQSCSVVGIEIDESQAEQTRPFCEELIVGDIETLNLSDKLEGRLFDVITFADVLEHLRDPAAALLKIRPFLSDKGYVVASIPNIAHCAVAFELAHGHFDYRQFGLLDNTHIHFFTKRTIFETFEKAGFLITELDRVRAKPSDTEFKTVPISPDDQKLLDYIYRINPESETYQFVIKAIPLEGQHSAKQAELITATDKILSLETALEANHERIRKLESEIEWLDRKPIQRFKNLFSKSFRKP